MSYALSTHQIGDLAITFASRDEGPSAADAPVVVITGRGSFVGPGIPVALFVDPDSLPARTVAAFLVNNPAAIVLVLSGNENPQLADDALAAGADGFILKQVLYKRDINYLPRQIHLALARRRLKRSLGVTAPAWLIRYRESGSLECGKRACGPGHSLSGPPR